MFMRVAVAIHGDDVEKVIETYNLMSTKKFIHASPTLFHAGLPDAPLSSCYIMPLVAKDVEWMFTSLTQCATISSCAGGVGLNVNDVYSAG